MYIVCEGLDSVGKTTQSKMLVDHFISKGQKAVWSREPGSPLISDYLNVRDLALSHKKLAPQTLELLMVADRAEHTAVAKELVQSGTTVVSDRSFISGLAYGMACGNDFSTLMMLYGYAVQLYPDHIFIMDMPLEIAEKRRELRGEVATREEVKGLQFKLDVQKNFRDLANQEYGALRTFCPKTKFHIIDATKSVSDIFKDISSKLENIL